VTENNLRNYTTVGKFEFCCAAVEFRYTLTMEYKQPPMALVDPGAEHPSKTTFCSTKEAPSTMIPPPKEEMLLYGCTEPSPFLILNPEIEQFAPVLMIKPRPNYTIEY